MRKLLLERFQCFCTALVCSVVCCVLAFDSTCKYLLFQHKQHSDNYIDQPEQERVYGVHTFYRQEIERILKEQTNTTPSTILSILIKNRNNTDMSYDQSIPLPTQQLFMSVVRSVCHLCTYSTGMRYFRQTTKRLSSSKTFCLSKQERSKA